MTILRVEKLVHGGYGLARTDTGIVFITGCLPNEEVKTHYVDRIGGCKLLGIEEIVTPSSFRVKPLCTLTPHCGGCDWQHIAEMEQIHLKKIILEDCLQRIGKITSWPSIELYQSPSWHYRIRAQIKINHANKHIGFYQRQTNEVIDMAHCPLLVEPLNTILSHKEKILNAVAVNTPVIKVIAGSDGVVASSPVIDKVTKPRTVIKIGSSNLVVEGNSFFQGNHFLLEQLAKWVTAHVQGERLIDLYGGVGFFSVFAAERVKQLTLVEEVPSQTILASENLKPYGHSQQIEIHTNRVENFLRTHRKISPNTIIIDPPRTGLAKEVREGIAYWQPQRLIYVSCEPATLARDANYFVHSAGYEIRHLALFDLYPQTHHLESVMIFDLSARTKK